MRIPLIDVDLSRPTRGRLAWYAGVGAMTTFGAIDWPLAAVIVAGDLISENSRSATVSGAAEGAQSAAG